MNGAPLQSKADMDAARLEEALRVLVHGDRSVVVTHEHLFALQQYYWKKLAKREEELRRLKASLPRRFVP